MVSMQSVFIFLGAILCQLPVTTSIDDYINAVGGVEKWRSIRNISITAEVNYYAKTYSADGIQMKPEKSWTHKLILADGRYFSENITVEGSKRRSVYDGSTMKQISPDGFIYEETTEVVGQYKKREIHLGEAWIAANADEVKFLGEESDAGNEYLVFLVTRLNFDRKYYVLKANNRLFKVTLFNGVTESFFEDYRDVDGYLVPFKITGYVNGTIEHETLVKEVKVNTAVPSTLFEK